MISPLGAPSSPALFCYHNKNSASEIDIVVHGVSAAIVYCINTIVAIIYVFFSQVPHNLSCGSSGRVLYYNRALSARLLVVFGNFCHCLKYIIIYVFLR